MLLRSALWHDLSDSWKALLTAKQLGQLQLTFSHRPELGDLQVNGVAKIAAAVNRLPEELARALMTLLSKKAPAWLCEVSVSGPGFLNIKLANHWIKQMLLKKGLKHPSVNSKKIVIDYSAPNIAKEMAVHHIRSTILGDAMARLSEYLGHKVVRANHVGDWGTQFGMLIALLKEQNQSVETLTLSELEHYYKAAKKRYDDDAEFAQRARKQVVRLQSGEQAALDVWEKLVQVSMKHNQAIYDALNVTLTPEDTRGESTYNPLLPKIVSDLVEKGIAQNLQSSIVVPLVNVLNKSGEPMAVVVQKKDGGFLYTTTDIACIQYRCQTLKADRVIYYVDSRQADHLKQAWDIARMANYIPSTTSVEHHAFGMMLGADGKPFKTREGQTPKLEQFVQEAHERAAQLLAERQVKLSKIEFDLLCNSLAVSAIKYSDLQRNRLTDYRFNWEEALSFQGNTAPYLLYAYTRIKGILSKIPEVTHTESLVLSTLEERTLALHLLKWQEILLHVWETGFFHLLCQYLHHLASLFSKFYEQCPVLSAETVELMQSRKNLCQWTAQGLGTGLELLGMILVDKM